MWYEARKLTCVAAEGLTDGNQENVNKDFHGQSTASKETSGLFLTMPLRS